MKNYKCAKIKLGQSYLCRYMLSRRGRHPGHEVGSDEGTDDDTPLTGRQMTERIPIQVKRQQDHWHLTDLLNVAGIMQDLCGQVVGLSERAQNPLRQEGGGDILHGVLHLTSKHVHYPADKSRISECPTAHSKCKQDKGVI